MVLDKRLLALNTVSYVEKLLDKFKRAVKEGEPLKFSDLEINDIADILGFYPDEIETLINVYSKS